MDQGIRELLSEGNLLKLSLNDTDQPMPRTCRQRRRVIRLHSREETAEGPHERFPALPDLRQVMQRRIEIAVGNRPPRV